VLGDLFQHPQSAYIKNKVILSLFREIAIALISPQRETTGMNISSDTISIRLATPDDASALCRLAALDSAEVPSGPVLLAEREGALHAALALSGHRTAALADPFVHSAELVELLRLRADLLRLRGSTNNGRRRALRFRRAFAA
jgi:hypothetical protein